MSVPDSEEDEPTGRPLGSSRTIVIIGIAGIIIAAMACLMAGWKKGSLVVIAVAAVVIARLLWQRAGRFWSVITAFTFIIAGLVLHAYCLCSNMRIAGPINHGGQRYRLDSAAAPADTDHSR